MATMAADATPTSIQALQARVDKLEQAYFECPEDEGILVDEQMRRARLGVESCKLYSVRWKWVPPAYYTWPLAERAACLNAVSPQHLCKSLLLENKKANSEASRDPTNPRFVLILIQYAASLDMQKLKNTIRALRPNVQERLDENQFDFRVASTEDNDKITGYTHNSVTPFGLLKQVPILLCEAIANLKHFWMGGGHVHLKLGMSVTDFVAALNPIIADLSQPRVGLDDADLD